MHDDRKVMGTGTTLKNKASCQTTANCSPPSSQRSATTTPRPISVSPRIPKAKIQSIIAFLLEGVFKIKS